MPEPQQETWLKLIVITVIVLAAAAGFSAFKSIGYATQAQIFAAREARHWQDYQVVSLQKENFGLNRDMLASLKPPEGKAVKGQMLVQNLISNLVLKSLAVRIKNCEGEMARLNQERDQIKKEAQALAAQEEALGRKAGELALAAILFQLGIMSSGAGALMRKKILWLVGLGLGAWGLVYVVKVLLL